MHGSRAFRLPVLLGAAMLVGCGVAQGPRQAPGAEPPGVPAPGVVKRITAATSRVPDGLTNTSSGGVSVGATQSLVHAGLTHRDGQSTLTAQLAEAVPTLENGLWKLFPNGRMELTWRLKSDVAWHDGAAFTTDDLLFTFQVMRDREVNLTKNQAYALIEGVEAPDARAIVVRWKEPFINADSMFGLSGTSSLAPPIPKHVLEGLYAEGKGTMQDLPYWTAEFVGLGPYRVREFSRDTHMILEANDRYVLGRPKIDVIEVRWIVDQNTLVANILAGGVDVTLGVGLSTDQGIQVRDRWTDGRVDWPLPSWLRMNPQFLHGLPIISNLQFRRALMHAMDRQSMVDTLQYGITPVAHVYISPSNPVYKETETSIVKYDYDPRRAVQMIEELELRKGADGVFRDRGNQPLSVEIRALESLDIQVKSMLTVADYWRQAGMGVETVAIPRARERDREYRQQFPGFELTRYPNDVNQLTLYHRAYIPLAENNFSGNNRSRYDNAELTALVDRFWVTIPQADRMQVLSQIVRHVTDQLVVFPLYYDTEATAVSHRLVNVAAAQADKVSITWNAPDWDVR